MDFLVKINPYFHYILMPWPRLVCHSISLCTHFRELPRYKDGNWFSSVTLHWRKQYQCHTKVFWCDKTISRVSNNTFLSLKHSCFLRVGIWKEMRGRLLNSLINFTNNRFNKNVQAGIFVAEYEGWIKVNENLLNREFIARMTRLQKML